MSFHSLDFILGFLPLALLAYFIARRVRGSAALVVLSIASLVFYTLGDIGALPVLLVSLLWNYGCGILLSRKKWILILGIAINVLLLAFYKYIPSINPILPEGFLPASVKTWVFPLGISFFTFTQISFLIELAGGRIARPNFLHYCAAVLFFPKLVAGPITRPSEILPQFSPDSLHSSSDHRFLQGISFFAIGLFKKIVIADLLAPISSSVFTTALHTSPTFYRAWFGATTYGLQLYFDFSGYTDMAIGVALLFGIALPVNFASPYTSTSIADFWRKWHITLASMSRDYLYIPLGGNRRGFMRRLVNLLVVMVIVGIWHGSGLTFAVWGALHGLCLILHAVWTAGKKAMGWAEDAGGWVGRFLGRALTFITVTILWVFFRAENLAAAVRMLRPMLLRPERLPISSEWTVAALVLLPPLFIVWFLPTTQRWLQYHEFLPPDPTATTVPIAVSNGEKTDVPPPTLEWRPTFLRGVIVGCLALGAVAFLSRGVAFIYGNF